MFQYGRSARLIAQRQETALEVAKIVKQLYESAWTFFEALIARQGWRCSPRYFLPVSHSDSVFGYYFKGMRSDLRVDTASGRGIGRSDRIDDAYCIEVADWERSTAESSINNLLTSQPVGNETTDFTIDFNANENWRSSHAHLIWANAHKEEDDPEWNGFAPFFIGTEDLPELYSEEFLAERLRVLGRRRFRLDYPRTKEDLEVQQLTAVHEAQTIDEALGRAGGKYLVDIFKEERLAPGELRILHGVDTASGSQSGDFQACVSFGWYDGLWWELCPPIHERVPEDVFAQHVYERLEQWPGVCVVERNVGSAVLIKLRELGARGLYKHRHRDKTGKMRRELGFPTTYATKRQAVAELDAILRAGEIAINSPALAKELYEVEYKHKDDGSEGPGFAGAPEYRGAHDDLWAALFVLFQGQYYKAVQQWTA